MLYTYYYRKKCTQYGDKPNVLFNIWMNKIENKIKNEIELNLLDLPDQDYMFMFETNKSVEYVVAIIINDFYWKS